MDHTLLVKIDLIFRAMQGYVRAMQYYCQNKNLHDTTQTTPSQTLIFCQFRPFLNTLATINSKL